MTAKKKNTPLTIEALKEALAPSFEAISIRFDSNDRRFTNLEKHNESSDRRFANLEKHNESNDRRFANLEKHNESSDRRFANLEKHNESSDRRFTGLEKHNESSDRRFANLEKHNESSDRRFTGLEKHNESSDRRFTGLEARLDHIDDQFKSLTVGVANLFETQTVKIDKKLKTLKGEIIHEVKVLLENDKRIEIAVEAAKISAANSVDIKEMKTRFIRLEQNIDAIKASVKI